MQYSIGENLKYFIKPQIWSKLAFIENEEENITYIS